MRIILNKNLWQDWGLTKPVPTCHNGYMMRNINMRENLPNENQSHLDFKSKLNNEISEVIKI